MFLFLDDDKYKWLVPITICTSENPTRAAVKTLLTDKEMVIFVKNVQEESWVKLNPGQVCFYRVSYSSEMLDDLIPAIANHSLQPIDRLGIQNDLFALVCLNPFLKICANFKPLRIDTRTGVNYKLWIEMTLEEEDCVVRRGRAAVREGQIYHRHKGPQFVVSICF